MSLDPIPENPFMITPPPFEISYVNWNTALVRFDSGKTLLVFIENSDNIFKSKRCVNDYLPSVEDPKKLDYIIFLDASDY